MLSFEHEFLVDLFRKEGKLTVELLRACAGVSIDHARVETRSIDLSQVVPTQYRADAVVVLRDTADRAVLGVVVEVQRNVDRVKRWSWPVYVTTLRAQFECPAVLLVVAPSRRVAKWARRPIEIGHPGLCMTPIVIGLEDVPRIRDPVEASRLPELAMLSTISHPEIEIVMASIEAFVRLPKDQARLYLDVLMKVLPASIRHSVEARMKQRLDLDNTPLGRSWIRGHKYGLQTGRRQALDFARTATTAVARAKGVELSSADVKAIESVADIALLTELVSVLADARRGPEARAVLRLWFGARLPRRARRSALLGDAG